MNKLIILSMLSTYLIFSQSSGNSIINIDGEYARRLYAGERMDECRVACIDSAKNNLIDNYCLLYTSPSPRDGLLSRMPSSA